LPFSLLLCKVGVVVKIGRYEPFGEAPCLCMGRGDGTVIPPIGLYPHILDPLTVDTDRLRSLLIKCKRILRDASPPTLKGPLQRVERSLIGFAQ
jgi:hypothetical protein